MADTAGTAGAEDIRVAAVAAMAVDMAAVDMAAVDMAAVDMAAVDMAAVDMGDAVTSGMAAGGVMCWRLTPAGWVWICG